MDELCRSVLSSPLVQRLEYQTESNTQTCTVSLEARETLVCIGLIKLQILEGQIEINGYTNSDSSKQESLRLYLPDSQSLPAIHVLSAKCKLRFILDDDIQKEWKYWKELCDFYSYKDMFGSLLATDERGGTAIFSVFKNFHIILSSLVGLSRLTVPSLWGKLVDHIYLSPFSSPSKKVMLVGNKGVGKSTFLRYMINALISKMGKRVFVLDFDPGQSEFSPPGLLSLHEIETPVIGPPFSHMMIKALNCEFLTSVSPSDCPYYYLQLCSKLYSSYLTMAKEEDICIMNSMGWLTGLGLDLLQALIHVTKPTHIVPFVQVPLEDSIHLNETESEVAFFQSGAVDEMRSTIQGLMGVESIRLLPLYKPNPEDFSSLGILPCMSKSNNAVKALKYSQKELRYLALTTYLTLNASFSFLPIWISRPFILPLKLITNVLPKDREEFMTRVNATVIGLYHNNDDDSKLRVSTPSVVLNTNCVCFGLGFVKCLDKVEQSLYIVSPISLEEMKKVNVLIRTVDGSHLNIFPIEYTKEYTFSIPRAKFSENNAAPCMQGSKNLRPRRNLRRNWF